MAKSGRFHGKAMGKPWESHGKAMGKPWESHGKAMNSIPTAIIQNSLRT